MVQPVAGKMAPAFEGMCSDGAFRSVADYRGKWLLLVFLRHFT